MRSGGSFWRHWGQVVAEAAEGLSALSLLVSSPCRMAPLLDNLAPGHDANEMLEAMAQASAPPQGVR